jgi:CrcB protein
LNQLLLLLLGGALGTGCRYFLSAWIYSVVRAPVFPYGNFVINVSGSFLIGVLAELLESRWLVSPAIRIALLTGVLGGYTTFSSFAFETYGLLRDGELVVALAYAGGSLLAGLAAVWLGVRLAQAM